MDHFFDKVKSAGVALFVGGLTCLIGMTIAVLLVAREHRVTANKTLGFIVEHPFVHWPTSMQLYSAFSVLLGIGITWVSWQVFRKHRWTIRPRTLHGNDATTDLLQKSEAKGKPRIFAGRYGNGQFHASIEDRGLVIGPPGTGKTAFLLNQILRLSKEKMSFVAVDMKPELHSILSTSLEREGYRVLRINPAQVDPGASHWNPLNEIKDEIDLAELVAALIPCPDPKQKAFIDQDRKWFSAGLFHVAHNGGSLPDVFEFLGSQSDPIQLLSIISESGSPQAVRISREMLASLSGEKPSPLIIPALSSCLSSLDFFSLEGVKSALGSSDFSVRELGQGRPTAIFLQLEEIRLGALGPVMALLTTAIMNLLIQTAGNRKPVAFFLDEIGNMPAIPGLAEKLNTIRSRHMPTWMYFQSIQQINNRYGHGADQIFLASADFLMAFRLNDHSTRQLLSDLIGTTEIVKISQSKSDGKTSVSRSKETKKVIEPHALGQLQAGEVVALYRGAAARGRATPHFQDFPEFRRKS